MIVQILSPYGKSVTAELRKIYGFAGPEAAAEFTACHVGKHYGLRDASVESLHIAFGLAAKIKVSGQYFYLKFASRSMNPSPEQLFPWLDYARQHGVPVPEVLRTVRGEWFLSPLSDSDYDVVYLMREIRGAPMREPHSVLLEQYAAAMARFHEVGLSFPYAASGQRQTWNGMLKRWPAICKAAEESPFVSSTLVNRAIKVVERAGKQSLSSTIINCDFRFCHVFFEEDRLTGVVDVDTATHGERWRDFCIGLLSGNSPEGGGFLSFDELRETLVCYDKYLPLDACDRSVLKSTFAFAGVETIWELVRFVANGIAPKEDIDSAQELLAAILDSSELLD